MESITAIPAGERSAELSPIRKKVADAIWAKIQVELQTGAYYDRKQIKTFSIQDLIEKYLEWFRDRKSFETERIRLSAIAAHFDRRTVSDITEHDVITFRNVRQTTPTKNGTSHTPAAVNREISVLKNLFGKTVAWGMARTNVASGIKPLKESKERPRFRRYGVAPVVRPVISDLHHWTTVYSREKVLQENSWAASREMASRFESQGSLERQVDDRSTKKRRLEGPFNPRPR